MEASTITTENIETTPAPEAATGTAENTGTTEDIGMTAPTEESVPKPPKSKKSKKAKGTGTKSKRGQGRPFAKLAQDVLDSRMQKLKKRIDSSKATFDKASAFYAKYVREAEFRTAVATEPASTDK